MPRGCLGRSNRVTEPARIPHGDGLVGKGLVVKLTISAASEKPFVLLRTGEGIIP